MRENGLEISDEAQSQVLRVSSDSDLDHASTTIKSNILKFKIHKKWVGIVLDQAAEDLGSTCTQHQSFLDNFKSSFGSIERLKNVVLNQGPSQSQGGQEKDVLFKQKYSSKILFLQAKFMDKLLRKASNQNQRELIEVGLQGVGLQESHLAKMVIEGTLGALNQGYTKAADMIPRMLDVVGQYREAVSETFMSLSKHTPAWLFLRWINQIASLVNRPESATVDLLVRKINFKYPQAMFYTFNVIQSNLEMGQVQGD